MEPLVSVLCMTYNHEKYIRRCLDGFAAQKTRFPFEVLVHDDASTDGTAGIVREYAAKYPDLIRPVYQTENQYSKGGQITERFLLPAARGKYLAFCEGDDFWCDPLKLQKQADALESHPECRMCTHQYDILREDGSFSAKGVRQDFPGGVLAPERVVACGPWPVFHTSSYFLRADDYRRYCTEKVKLREIPEVGDLGILLYFCAAAPLYYLPETMSCYRHGAVGSWTQRVSHDTVKRLEMFIAVEAAYEDYDRFTGGRFHDACAACERELNEKIFFHRMPRRYLLKKTHRARFRTVFPDRRERTKLALGSYFPRMMARYESWKAKKNKK